MKTFFLILIGFAGATKLDKRGNRDFNGLDLNPKYTLGVGNLGGNDFGEVSSKHGSKGSSKASSNNRF